MTDQTLPSPGVAAFERLPVRGLHPIVAPAATLAIVAFAFAARTAVGPWLPPGIPFITFFPAVVVASILFGWRSGALAAVLGGLIAWYAFIPPALVFSLDLDVIIALSVYALVTGTEVALVHWMQLANARLAAERELSARLAEMRELLFRELQHRVSNNLQVAAALLSLQRRKVAHEDARAALDEASRRLALIGRISRQLYDAGGGTRSLADFLQPLCADVIEASGRTGVDLTVRAEADAPLSSEQAVPVALVVAEAISNSIEHGFAGRTGGRIDVALRRTEGAVDVEVADDGHGLPRGFELDRSDSLGLRIAAMLADQLGGRFTLEPRAAGAVARLTLPA
ncbi:MAG TPA: histidine kinase dimerization/phosphoacceptor domain -containing protein [Sphingomonas sp.]